MTTLHQSSLRGGRRGRKLGELVKQRRALVSRLQKLEGKIAELSPKHRKRRGVSPETLDQILEELASGGVRSKYLPTDFSRADIYDDHD